MPFEIDNLSNALAQVFLGAEVHGAQELQNDENEEHDGASNVQENDSQEGNDGVSVSLLAHCEN